LLHKFRKLSKLTEQEPACPNEPAKLAQGAGQLSAPARRLCLAVARGGAYGFGGGGNGSRTGSGLILARIAFSVLMRGDMK
jgi:hypothetical protein